jgi:chromosome partitioning protein
MKKIGIAPRQAATLLSSMTGKTLSASDLLRYLPEEKFYQPYEPSAIRHAHGALMTSRRPALSGVLSDLRPDRRPPVMVSHYKKGGTGKTTILCNVAIALAMQGYRVLYIDVDPQGTSTTLFGVDIEDPELRTLQHVLFGYEGEPVSLERSRIPLYDNAVLDLIPSDISLSAFDRLGFGLERKNWLYFDRLLQKNPEFFSRYEWVLVDTNPGTNLLNQNMMVPADYLLMPVSLDVPSMKSMRLMAAEAAELHELGASAKGLMIVANIFHAAMRHSQESLDALTTSYPNELLNTVVPAYAGVSRQGWSEPKGRTLLEKEPSSPAARKLVELSVEIANRVYWEPLREAKQHASEAARTAAPKAAAKKGR